MQLANIFNYKLIFAEDVMKEHIELSSLKDINWLDDDLVNKCMFNALVKTEKHFRGIIISGYPNNFN